MKVFIVMQVSIEKNKRTARLLSIFIMNETDREGERRKMAMNIAETLSSKKFITVM